MHTSNKMSRPAPTLRDYYQRVAIVSWSPNDQISDGISDFIQVPLTPFSILQEAGIHNRQEYMDSSEAKKLYPKYFQTEYDNEYAAFRKEEEKMPVIGIDDDDVIKKITTWRTQYANMSRKLIVFEWDKVISVISNMTLPEDLTMIMLRDMVIYCFGIRRLHDMQDLFARLHSEGIEIAITSRNSLCATENGNLVMKMMLKFLDPLLRQDQFICIRDQQTTMQQALLGNRSIVRMPLAPQQQRRMFRSQGTPQGRSLYSQPQGTSQGSTYYAQPQTTPQGRTYYGQSQATPQGRSLYSQSQGTPEELVEVLDKTTGKLVKVPASWFYASSAAPASSASSSSTPDDRDYVYDPNDFDG